MTIVGNLVATLRLDGASQFDAEAARAKQALDRLTTAGGNVGRAIQAGMQVAGTVLNLTAAGVTALGGAAVTAGAKFNVLQQNSGVALKTLMGSTEAARAQMVRLNDFASNSPFGRDTFIKAQQTLLGFGLEASKVVPYLDAIQNQVAGIGGSNANIDQIVQTIAKIRSSATLGQQDLMELANQGVNAAALIAEATGKTEQEVRNSIFGNPLRGEEALAGLDAMMQGMQTKFGGTTTELKKQWDGARDRVQAAVRDIGAILTADFVRPEGGGWAVRWANSTADVLRAFQAGLRPVWADIIARATPAFQAIETGLQRVRYAVTGWSLNDLAVPLERIRPVLPVVAGGLAAMSSSALAGVPIIGQLVAGVNPLVAGLAAAAAASPELRGALVGVLGALKPLVRPATDVARIFATTLSGGLGAVAAVLEAVTPGIATVSKLIAGIPAPVLAAATAITVAVVAFKALRAATSAMDSGQAVGGWMGAFASGTKAASEGAKTLGRNLAEMGRAAATAAASGVGPTGVAMAAIGPAATAAKGGVLGIGTALKTAFLANPIGVVILGITTAITLMAGAAAEAEQRAADMRARIEGLKGTLDETTGALTDQTQAMMLSNLQASEWGTRAKELAGGTGTLAQMVDAATRSGGDFYDQLVRLGAAQVDWDKRISGGTMSQWTYAQALERTATTAGDWVRAAAGNKDAIEDLRAAWIAAGFDVRDFEQALAGISSGGYINVEALQEIERMSGELDTATDEVKTHADAMRELRESSGDAAVAQERLNEALRVSSDTAADASSRIRAAQEAIDILNGGTISAAAAQQRLDDATRSLEGTFSDVNEALAANTDAVGGIGDNYIDASGKIDTSTEAGSRLRDALSRLTDEAWVAAMAAVNLAESTGGDSYAAAVDALQPYIASVLDLGEQFDLTDEQVQGMLADLGLFPEQIAVALALRDADEVTNELGQVAMRALALDEGETTVEVGALTESAMEKLDLLGITVNDLGNGQHSITLDADPAKAQEQIDRLVSLVTGTESTVSVGADTSTGDATVSDAIVRWNGTTARTSVGADTAPADGEVVAWKLQADGTWAVVHMDAEKAEADEKVIVWKREADGTWSEAHIGAEAATAYDALASFKRNADGTYTLVTIDGDNSSAQGAINDLNNQTVYVNVVARGGGAPAMEARRDGGLDVHTARGMVQAFASGGFPTGLYRGGTPIYKFAEPETRWEAFVSGRPGQELRNLRILEEAEQRLRSQLGLGQKVRTFASGGLVSHGAAPSTAGVMEVRGAIYLDGRALAGEFRGQMEQVAASAVAADRRARERVTAHGRRKEH